MLIEPVTPVGVSRPQPVQRVSFTPEHHAATSEQPLPVGSKAAHTHAANESKSIDDAVRELNESVEPFNISLQFSSDEDSGSTVIRMVDQRTGEVLRQIPDEARLHLAAALGKLQGRIFNRQA